LDAPIITNIATSGNRNPNGISRRHEGENPDRGEQPDGGLAYQFDTAWHAFGVALGQLQKIVGEADGAVADGDEQGRPDIAVIEIGPEQRGDAEGEKNEHAAHRGRAFLLDQMPLRPVEADRLAVLLHGFQQPDQFGPQPETDDQRRQAGAARAEGDVAEQVEDMDVAGERQQQCV
jgi:hypothetical protein